MQKPVTGTLDAGKMRHGHSYTVKA